MLGSLWSRHWWGPGSQHQTWWDLVRSARRRTRSHDRSLISSKRFGFWVQDSLFSVQGPGFRVQGSGFRVHASGFRVQGQRLRESKRERPGRGAARAEDAQETPTQSHISPSILVYQDCQIRGEKAVRHSSCTELVQLSI